VPNGKNVHIQYSIADCLTPLIASTSDSTFSVRNLQTSISKKKSSNYLRALRLGGTERAFSAILEAEKTARKIFHEVGLHVPIPEKSNHPMHITIIFFEMFYLILLF
jgi:hypothetical protein